MPLGDLISRCTADVETLDTVFSSGVAMLLAHLVRLVTIAVAMVVLSPVSAASPRCVAAPLGDHPAPAGARPRQAERENRAAVGAINAQLQEDLEASR